MILSESDTRAKLIDPAIHARGWTEDLSGKRLTDATTGEALSVGEVRERYEAPDIEDKLLMPERVAAMTKDLFSDLLATGGP